MPSQQFRKYRTDISIASGDSYELPRNMLTVYRQQYMVIQNWDNGTDAATTGISVSILPGMGESDIASDSSVKYATDDPATVDHPPQVQPPTALGAGDNEYITVFDVRMSSYPQHQKLVINNNDASKAVRITIWGNE